VTENMLQTENTRVCSKRLDARQKFMMELQHCLWWRPERT